MNVKKKKKILCSFETLILTYDTRKKEITRKKYFIYLLEEINICKHSREFIRLTGFNLILILE